MMNLARLRNGKARVLLGIAAAAVLLIVTFVIHDTHTKLVTTRSHVQDCEHKQESLSAQLQVVHEHRTRLEKALQQEKLAHKQTKEKLESQYEELQEQTDKEKQEALSKHATLQQQYKALQSQQDDLHEEFSKLQQTNAELQEEKQNLINKMTSQADQMRISKDEEIVQLQKTVNQLQSEKDAIAAKMDQTVKIRELQDELNHCKMEIVAQQIVNQAKIYPSPIGPKPRDAVKSSAFAIKAPPSAHMSLPVVQKQETEPKTLEREKQSPAETLLTGAINEAVSSDAKNNQLPLALPQNVQHDSNLPGVLAAPNVYPDKNVQAPAASVQENNDGHQLANPHDVDLHPNEEVQKQLEQPRKVDGKKLAIVEPHPARDRKDGADVYHRGAAFGPDAEPEANGLEQQENGDQDLDDMENEILGDKRENNQFEDADFDQADQDDNDGNRNNNNAQPAKQEGVIAAPH